ncbi:putative sporulation protein YtaF [Sporomusaceae bacterium BoRhaA]|uniref:sporulation membrane protein YtaF n=1 Tax=Pelorhabdus rhamnosifermentans TaxID=2772457 RepID=UPI001C060C7C|nr:sporulation membrane protein YtaF [Pelorhabdus rhamnosifermentans]MBU2700077.1 putative sporulation protein YtaF [Pelorhabdus rhamnosifermentans]
MNFIPMLLMAVSSNLDNLGVGVSYGTRKITLSSSANLIVALITSIGTFVSIAFGEYISSFLSLKIANTIGALIIIAAGFWVIWLGKQADREDVLVNQPNLLTAIIKDPSRADFDKSGDISNYEGMTLGVALTMNNLSAGIGGGMAGMNPVATTALVFVLSIVTLWLGFFCGNQYTSRWFDDKAGLVSGALLVMIGVYEYLA